MPVRVSVVVPVYEPGAGFDELLSSLDRQTLDPAEFEVLLCDDGSGEATRERLAEAARSRPNVRVLTLERTGWPGAPRNRGVDAARGDYVFFSDQDDRLFERGLEELCAFADRHSSDVVIGKVVGIGRRIPRAIFQRDLPHAVLGHDPLLELLTPHKLFRTAFLREHGIRFPEGRVRLEDHLFVMRAYFAAETISVLASVPCYGWVKNRGSASSSRIDPATYFPHLEAVLDLVEANTEPGKLRDTLLRHWYRGKILKRLDGARVVRYPAEYLTAFLDVVTPIAQRRFGPGVVAGLPFPLRVRSALLRADRRDEVRSLAEFEAGLTCRATVSAARWTRRGRLALTVDARFVADGQDGLVFEPSPSGAGARSVVWRPPAALGGLDEILPADALDARRDLRQDRVRILLRGGSRGTDLRSAGPPAKGSAPATVVIDPLEAFDPGGAAQSGALIAEVRHAGWTFEVALRADPAIVDALPSSPFLAGRRCDLVRNDAGALELRRAGGGAGLVRDRVARTFRAVGRSGRGALRRLNRIRLRGSSARSRARA